MLCTCIVAYLRFRTIHITVQRSQVGYFWFDTIEDVIQEMLNADLP